MGVTPGRYDSAVNDWLSMSELPRASVAELLAENALVEAVPGIEQHVHGYAVIHADFDGADGAHLVVVRDSGDGALLGLEHIDGDPRAIRQQGTAPAPRPEWTDGCERQ
jgi:hypothetical protein